MNGANIKLMSKRLRQSDQFAQTFDASGQAIVYRFSAPQAFSRISETTRLLLACFPSSTEIEVEEAIGRFSRILGPKAMPCSLVTAISTVRMLTKLGALVPATTRSSRYNRMMATHYVRSRAIPSQVCKQLIHKGQIHRDTRILDIGTGTGNIALQLAEVSDHVNGIDISVPFMEKARSLAASRRVKVRFDLGCGNKLAFSHKQYDVITMSQVFHWLDPLWAARGIYQCLKTDGTLFIIEPLAFLPIRHPLRQLLGYGCKSLKEVQRMWVQRSDFYTGLFRSMMRGDGSISITGERRFCQRYRFDMTYARAFFFTSNFKTLIPGQDQPWEKLRRQFDKEPEKNLDGDMYWCVLQLSKSAKYKTMPPFKFDINDVTTID